MKKVLFVAFVLLSSIAFAQDSIPAKVQRSFEQKYPQAETWDWQIEDEFFLALFTQNEVSMIAKFEETGKWLETGVSISEEDLPEIVSEKVFEHFKEGWISGVMKFNTCKKEIYYELLVETDQDTYKLKVSPKGKIKESEMLHADCTLPKF